MDKKPKILFFDIETSPNLCYTWQLGKQRINYDQIYKERKITCICWKWLGKSKIHSLSLNLAKHDLSLKDDDSDKAMLEEFSAVYGDADLAVGHNAVSFDKGFIRSRLMKHGLPDIAPVVIDDTYILSKSIRLNSHKLDYISQYIGVGKKTSHPYSLWTGVMNGEKTALDKTVSYCKNDVQLLEKVYKALKPYIKTKINLSVFSGDNRKCPSCGHSNLVRNGQKLTASGKKLKLHCTGCGKYSTQSVTEEDKPKGFPVQL